MENFNFGNLKDWGQVLETLENLTQKGQLEKHQGQLIRLLRFDQNWRLREAAIESLEFIDNPSIELANEVFSIVTRKDLYYDVRILAVAGLSSLVERIVGRKDLNSDDVNAFVDQTLTGLEAHLETPEPPKFHDAVTAALIQLRRNRSAA